MEKWSPIEERKDCHVEKKYLVSASNDKCALWENKQKAGSAYRAYRNAKCKCPYAGLMNWKVYVPCKMPDCSDGWELVLTAHKNCMTWCNYAER